MFSMFARKPIAELEPPGDTAHSLKRVLGAGDLVMLAIGAVIGAGIFAPLGAAACVFVMIGLPTQAWVRFGWWLGLGLLMYLVYGMHHSRLRGRT